MHVCIYDKNKKIKWRKAIISADILYLFLTFWKICLVFTLRGKPKTNQDLASALYKYPVCANLYYLQRLQASYFHFIL